MWVVLSSKGGVGKSMVAKNLLIPYVVQKYNQALYVNTDDTNDEHKLVKAKNFSVETTRITPKEIRKLEPLPYAILDTGAGRNVIEVLNVLSKMDYNQITKVVIVLSKRLSEINEAIKTFKVVKKLGFQNIVLVLNKVFDLNNLEEEFSTLFSPIKDKQPLINYFGETKEKLILFPYDDKEILGNMEDLEQRLPYDIYLEADSFISQYREKLIRREVSQEDRTKRLFYGFLQDIFQEILSERNLNLLSEVDNG